MIGMGLKELLVGGVQAHQLAPGIHDQSLGHSISQSQQLDALNHRHSFTVSNDVETDSPRHNVGGQQDAHGVGGIGPSMSVGKHTDICKEVKTHRMEDDFTATQEADQSAVTWLMSEETTRPTCL